MMTLPVRRRISKLEKKEVTTITSAQLLALNATPITIAIAPGAGKVIIPEFAIARHDGGTAYAGIAAGEDLAFKYTDGSGGVCMNQIETTGFLDQTTAQIRATTASSTFTPVANAAVVAHLLSDEIITGDFDLQIEFWYTIASSTFEG